MATESEIERRVRRRTSELVASNEALRAEIAERQRMEAALLESEERLRVFVESAPAAIAMLDREMRYVLVSRRWLSDYNLGERDLIGLSHYEVFPEIPDRWKSIHQRILGGESLSCDRDPFPRADGHTEWVSWEGRPWRDRHGEVAGILLFTEVITPRIEAEEQLWKIERARRALSRCNQVLIRAREEVPFLQDICRIIVEVAGYRMCWVGYAQHDPARSVRPMAYAGYEDGYLKTVNVTWADTERGRGPCGTCIRTGEVAVFRDVSTDPKFDPWREDAIKRGYASVIGVPLAHEGEVLGALTIYASEPDAFDDAEVNLLTELAGDLSYGVLSLRARAQRRQAEEALRTSEQKYRHLFEDLGDAAFVIDAATGRILTTNRQGELLLGAPREQIVGMHEDQFHPLEQVRPSRWAISEDGVSPYTADYESVITRPDGSIVPVHVREALQALNGDRSILALYRDITDRKRAQQALRRAYDELETRVENRTEELSRANQRLTREVAERTRIEAALRSSEQLYRQLTEGTLDAIVVADQKGLIRLFNSAAERTFGYQEREVLGQSLALLMPESYRARHDHSVQRYVETRVPHVVGQTVELHGQRKNGEIFPIEVSLSAIELPDGLVFLGAIRDLTDRHRMHARVMQAEKLASLGMLSAGVAHEINNPLAYVANNLVVLERDYTGLAEILDAYEAARNDLGTVRPDLAERIRALDEQIDLRYIRENLGRILNSTRQGVKRVSDIVQNLRGFARLDQTAVDRIQLQDAVTSSLEMIQGRLTRRRIEVTLIPGDLPPVYCAPAQINQVVLNLLVNAMQAIDATGRGHGRITIRTRHREDEVILEIEDDGCGMPREVVSRIFDPFYTTKPVGQGTGLGLSISHGIITDHGGRIEVESELGRGSTFRVILPLDSPLAPDSADPEKTATDGS